MVRDGTHFEDLCDLFQVLFAGCSDEGAASLRISRRPVSILRLAPVDLVGVRINLCDAPDVVRINVNLNPSGLLFSRLLL